MTKNMLTLLVLIWMYYPAANGNDFETIPNRICNPDLLDTGFEILKARGDNIPTETLMLQKESRFDTIYIQTSAKCKMCKERIEHDMSFEKGVKDVELNLENKVLMVVYRKSKTTEKDLKSAVTKIGYDADELVADQKAHDRLPACCQKDVDPH